MSGAVSLAGRCAIVTGGTRGIGKAIAKAFAAAGANVVVSGRDEAAGAAALDELGGSVSFVRADAGDADDCARLVEAALEGHGRLDVVSANAGIFPRAMLHEITPDHVAEVFATNVFGSIYLLRAALPALEQSPAGRVVLISSITGPLVGDEGWSVYGASKAAQLGFMRTAALELASAGITVNAVLPGNVYTEPDPHQHQMVGAIPMQRLGTTDEIGSACVFLASDEAGYITGQTIVVDGGQTLPEFRGPRSAP